MYVSITSFGLGTAIAYLVGKMKHNIVPVRKVALVTVVFCTAMFAFSQNASAERRPMPHGVIPVPDGGATIMLLGAALGSLGMARRFLKR